MAFNPLADVFRDSLLDALIGSMVTARFLKVPEGDIPEDLVGKVWEIGFFVLGQLEESGGFDAGDGPHWGHLAFTPRGKTIADGPVISTTSRTVLHGGLTYDHVRAAMERVRG